MKGPLLILCFLVLFILTTTFVYGQLKEIKRIPIESQVVKTLIAPNGKILNFLNKTEGQEEGLISESKIVLEEGEYPRLLTNDFLFTSLFDTREGSDNLQIIKYALNENKLSEVMKLEYPSYRTVTSFFPNGGFCGNQLDSRTIEFYSLNLELTGTYTPYTNGYEMSSMSIFEDKILISTSRSLISSSKLALLSSSGDILFERELEFEGLIDWTLASNKYNAFKLYNEKTKSYKIRVFDENGNHLWAKEIKDTVQKWRFGDLSSVLTIASHKGLTILNASDGKLIKSISWKGLFIEQGIKDLRPEHPHVNISGIEYFGGNNVAVLINQRTREGYVNNFLLTVELNNLNIKAIQTGVASHEPEIYKNGQGIFIQNGIDIIQYTDSK